MGEALIPRLDSLQAFVILQRTPELAYIGQSWKILQFEMSLNIIFISIIKYNCFEFFYFCFIILR